MAHPGGATLQGNSQMYKTMRMLFYFYNVGCVKALPLHLLRIE